MGVIRLKCHRARRRRWWISRWRRHERAFGRRSKQISRFDIKMPADKVDSHEGLQRQSQERGCRDCFNADERGSKNQQQGRWQRDDEDMSASRTCPTATRTG